MPRWNVGLKSTATLAGLALTGAVATPGRTLAQSYTQAPVQTEVQQAQAWPAPSPGPPPNPKPALLRAQAPRSRKQPAKTQPTQVQTEGPAAPAAPTPEAAPNTGRMSLSLGADWASAYYFRGIATTRTAATTCSRMPRSVSHAGEQGPPQLAHVRPGIWNNFHYGNGPLVNPSDPKFWFESDLYLKLSATWWDTLATAVTYTYYTSPNDSFATYADVGLSVGLNDAKWLGDFANPTSCSRSKRRGKLWPAPTARRASTWGLAWPRVHVLRGLLDPAPRESAHDLRL